VRVVDPAIVVEVPADALQDRVVHVRPERDRRSALRGVRATVRTACLARTGPDQVAPGRLVRRGRARRDVAVLTVIRHRAARLQRFFELLLRNGLYGYPTGTHRGRLGFEE